MINRLMTEIQKLDPDVLVGHNISGFDLDVLLHRAQVLTFSVFDFLTLYQSVLFLDFITTLVFLIILYHAS